MPRSLTEFTIVAQGDGYRLAFVLDDGATVDFLASFEQLDLLSEEIDRRLDVDEERED